MLRRQLLREHALEAVHGRALRLVADRRGRIAVAALVDALFALAVQRIGERRVIEPSAPSVSRRAEKMSSEQLVELRDRDCRRRRAADRSDRRRPGRAHVAERRACRARRRPVRRGPSRRADESRCPAAARPSVRRTARRGIASPPRASRCRRRAGCARHLCPRTMPATPTTAACSEPNDWPPPSVCAVPALAPADPPQRRPPARRAPADASGTGRCRRAHRCRTARSTARAGSRSSRAPPGSIRSRNVLTPPRCAPFE